VLAHVWFLGGLDKATFVLGLKVRRLRGNVAEICLRCGVSRLGDVVFVGSETRRYCEGGVLGGSRDDVRIYNRALPVAEVQQLYLMGK
jgi:hypothetical protein